MKLSKIKFHNKETLGYEGTKGQFYSYTLFANVSEYEGGTFDLFSKLDFSGSVFYRCNTPESVKNAIVVNRGDFEGVSLQGFDLRDVDFPKSNLENTDLSYAQAERSSFENSNMSRANLKQFSASDSSFERVNFKGANFIGSGFDRCSFKDANLKGVLLKEIDMTNCNFLLANLKGSNLEGSNLLGSNLQHILLDQNTILKDCLISDPSLLHLLRKKRFIFLGKNHTQVLNQPLQYFTIRNIDLTKSKYSMPKLVGVRFRDLDAEGLELKVGSGSVRSCSFNGVNLSSAKLKELVFNKSDFKKVNFSNADLKGTTFIHGELRDVDFTGANLQGAVIHSSVFFCSFKDADLSNALLTSVGLEALESLLEAGSVSNMFYANRALSEKENKYLQDIKQKLSEKGAFALYPGADLRGVDLSGLTIYETTQISLEGADLRGADLRDVDLRWVYLRGANMKGALASSTTLFNRIVTKEQKDSLVYEGEAEDIDLLRFLDEL